MKQLIQIKSKAQTLTTVSRVIKDGMVKYRNQSFKVSDSNGGYVIDLTNPIQTTLEQLSDDEIVAKAYEILEKRYLDARNRSFLESPDAVKELFRLRHSGLPAEQFDIAFLCNRHRLLEIRTLFKGTSDSASVYPREVVRACIETNACALILSHNHPSGVAEPSRADVEITKTLKKAVDLIGVRILDHIISGDGYSVSLAERGEM